MHLSRGADSRTVQPTGRSVETSQETKYRKTTERIQRQNETCCTTRPNTPTAFVLLVRNLGRADDNDDDDAVMAMVDAESEEEASAAFSGVDGLNAGEEDAVADVEEDDEESTPVAVTTAPNAVPASDGGGEDVVAVADEDEDDDEADEADRDKDEGAPACALLPSDTSAATGNSAAESARPAGKFVVGKSNIFRQEPTQHTEFGSDRMSNTQSTHSRPHTPPPEH